MRLINRVVEHASVMEAALELAAVIAAQAPAAVRMSKRSLQANLEIPSLAAALELENRGQALLTRTEDMKKAAASLLERRRPVFTNR